ncbi:MAG: hypothetical protein ACOCWB_03215 [Bacteroidota bacterium]
MIAATIGKTFLKTFNEKTGKKYSAKEFFEKEYFECFYNHLKYMQWINNSPFDQISKRKLNHISEERIKALQEFNSKVCDRKIFDGSTVIGYPASEQKGYAVTSGQVTDIQFCVDENEAYFSWIGSGLSIGTGKLSILFDNPEILYDTYLGWRIYRGLLNDVILDKLKGNQINSWNGLWLSFLYSKNYREYFDTTTLTNNNFFSNIKDGIELNKINWSELIFNLSRKYKDSIFIGYVHSVGDTNQTIGFIPFHFQKVTTILKYYRQLFGENAYINDASKYQSLFGKDSLSKACELGSIGLQALEPKNLRKYFGNDSNLKLLKPKTGNDEEKNNKAFQKDYENIITYRTYKTWLLAMITKNKEESLEYTAEVAKALHEYRDKASKNDRKNLIDKELLSAKSKKQFLDALVTIVKEVEQDLLQVFKTLRNKVHLMSAEDFGYFVVLLKFDYAYEERERN